MVERHAVAEIAALGPPCPKEAVFGNCSAIHRMMIDYLDLRDMIRAIEDREPGGITGFLGGFLPSGWFD